MHLGLDALSKQKILKSIEKKHSLPFFLGSLVNGGSGQIDDKIMKDLKSDLNNCQNQLKSKASEIAGLTSINERLKLEVEEKVHDLKMAQKNMDHLKEMLEEKSNTTESQQQERLQNIAGNISIP